MDVLRKLYDGALFCGQCSNCNCPVVEDRGEEVLVYDPAKPERGKLFVSKIAFERFVRELRSLTPIKFGGLREISIGAISVATSVQDASLVVLKVASKPLESSVTVMTKIEFDSLIEHVSIA